jgi:hypothetical protein
MAPLLPVAEEGFFPGGSSMQITLQFPFADARPFISADTHRVLRPTWEATPDPDSHFIRSFGPIREEPSVGVSDWPGNEFFCDARRLIRFVGRPAETTVDTQYFGSAVKLRPSGAVVRPFCAFRRLQVSPNTATVRLELGFGYRRLRPWPGPLGGKDMEWLFANVLSTGVKSLPNGKAEEKAETSQPLFDWAGALPHAYLTATTHRSAASPPSFEPWWVRPRMPLMLLEYDPARDFGSLPAKAEIVDAVSKEGVSVAYRRVRFKQKSGGSAGKDVGVWLLAVARGADVDYVRRLRIQLFRLHAEQQTIAAIFQLIASGRITVKPREPAADRLQLFLRDSVRLLTKKDRMGIPQSEILLAAQKFDAAVDPGSTASLLAALDQTRRAVFRDVSKYAAEVQHRPEQVVNVLVIDKSTRNITMTNQTVNVTNSTIGELNQVAAGTIKDSFNKVAGAPGGELKTQLEELHRSVEAILPKLPADKQKTTAEDLKTLTDQALSEKPRREWYELSAKGLLEAAEFVGDLAKPLKTALAAVVALLA